MALSRAEAATLRRIADGGRPSHYDADQEPTQQNFLELCQLVYAQTTVLRQQSQCIRGLEARDKEQNERIETLAGKVQVLKAATDQMTQIIDTEAPGHSQNTKLYALIQELTEATSDRLRDDLLERFSERYGEDIAERVYKGIEDDLPEVIEQMVENWLEANHE